MSAMNMHPDDLQWEHLIQLPDEHIPLLSAVLLIARDEYPDLDAGHYETQIAHHAQTLAVRLGDQAEPRARLAELNRYLFQEQGFAGNQQDFYDPRNSYLNDVLDRRLGIPISLGILQMELARRLGLDLAGVSFPGHFLVRMPVEGGLLVIDPYHQGRSLDAEELKLRARPHLGGNDIDDQQLLDILAPAGHRSILARMLRNLKAVYAEREAWDKAVRCADRLVQLDPTQPEELRDRGLYYLNMGHRLAAQRDLGTYLRLHPQAEDGDSVRELLIDAGATPMRLN